MEELAKDLCLVDPSGGGRDTAGIIGVFLGAETRVWITHDQPAAMSSAE
ncbi:hypothetical protein ACIQPR_44915 [Streptomyces sp. NPDC091280]